MAHANAITGATVYIGEGQELPPDEFYSDRDGLPLPGVRLVGPGMLVETPDVDIQVGGDGG